MLFLLKYWKPIALILLIAAISAASYQAGVSREQLKCNSELQKKELEKQDGELKLQELQIQSKQNVIKIKTLQNQVASSASYRADAPSRAEFLRIIYSES